jgi:hypothetical protein
MSVNCSYHTILFGGISKYVIYCQLEYLNHNYIKMQAKGIKKTN